MKYFPITLDKARNLGYGMVALDKIEKKLKKSVSEMDMNSLTIYEMAIYIWAGLSHEDSKLTPERVMYLVDEYSSMPEAMAIMGEAFAGAFPSPDPVVEDTDESKND